MKIGYGIAVQESDDPYISIAEELLSGASQAGIPGAFLVDLFSNLKYVPSWFPGAGFQRKLHDGKKLVTLWPTNHSVMCKSNWYEFVF